LPELRRGNGAIYTLYSLRKSPYADNLLGADVVSNLVEADFIRGTLFSPAYDYIAFPYYDARDAGIALGKI